MLGKSARCTPWHSKIIEMLVPRHWVLVATPLALSSRVMIFPRKHSIDRIASAKRVYFLPASLNYPPVREDAGNPRGPDEVRNGAAVGYRRMAQLQRSLILDRIGRAKHAAYPRRRTVQSRSPAPAIERMHETSVGNREAVRSNDSHASALQVGYCLTAVVARTSCTSWAVLPGRAANNKRSKTACWRLQHGVIWPINVARCAKRDT